MKKQCHDLSKTAKAILIVLTLLSWKPSSVSACGGFFCQPQQPVLQAGENIAFGVRQNGNSVKVDMAVQINYEGPAEDFAWILPVPAQPEISTGSDLLFTGLFEATRPTFSFSVDNSRSTTCTDEQLQDELCSTVGGFPESGAPVADEEAEDGDVAEAVVLDEGSVGPFNFVILEAAQDRPESVFEWLNDNGYDQPIQAEPLITYYAGMGMKFVALQLKKDTETGLIRPVVLQYEIPGDLTDTPVACIPIQLTSIAAIPDMPIQIYLLAPSRGAAYNYVDLEIDMGFIDWVSCQAFGGQNCYLNSLRLLVDAAASDVDGHAVITEYAGPTTNLAGSVAVDITLSDLYGARTALEFLTMLSDADVPAVPLVHTIIERYIPNRFQNGNGQVPPFCQSLMNVYTPDTFWMMNSCLDFVDYGNGSFDPVTLANELNTEILQPAQDAQDWMLSYSYLTRLYAQLDPDEMNKDPFFVFNPDLPDVSGEIEATGVPVCDGAGPPIGLDIYVGDATDPSTQVEAFLSCGIWIRPPGTLFGSTNPALSFTGYGLQGESATTVFRNPSTGQFAADEVESLVTVLDDRVPDQTVPGRIDPPANNDDESNDDEEGDDKKGSNKGSGGDMVLLVGILGATISILTTFTLLIG